MTSLQMKQDNTVLQAANEALRNENENISMDSAQVKKDNAVNLDDLLLKDNCEEYLISPIDAFPNFDVIEVNERVERWSC